MENIVIDVEIKGGDSSVKTVKELHDYVQSTIGTVKKWEDKLKSVNGYLKTTQAAIKSLNDEQKNYGKLSEGQQKQLDKLTTSANKLKIAIADYQQKFNAQVKELRAAEGSYDQMNQLLGLMRDHYRGLSEARRESASGKEELKYINQLDTKLKEIDATMGNHQRNVGNYPKYWGEVAKTSNRIENGFRSIIGTMELLGIESDEVSKSLLKIQVGFDVVSKAAYSLPGIIKSFQAAKAAAIAFAGGMNIVKVALVSTGIGALVVGVGLLIANWEKISKLWRDPSPQDIAREAIERLDEAMKKNAETTDAAATGAIERYRKALQDAGNDIEAVRKADRAYELEKLEAARKEAKRDLDAIQRAQVKIDNAALLAESEKEINEVREQQEELDKKESEARAKLAQAELALQKEITDELVETENKRLDAAKKVADERKKLSEEAKKERDKEIDEIVKALDDIYLANLTEAEKEIELLTRKYDKERELFEKYGLDSKRLLVQFEQEKREIIEKYADKESEERTDGAIKALDEGEKSAIDTINNRETNEFDNPVEQIEDQMQKIRDIMAVMEEFGAQKQAVWDAELEQGDLSLEREFEITNQKMQLDSLLLMKRKQNNEELKKLEEKAAKERTKMLLQQSNTTLKSVGGMLTAVSGLFEESSEANKALQIAGVTVNAIAGVSNAIASAMTLPPFLATIVGAANAALVVSTAAAQIAKINSDSKNLGNDASPSVASQPVTGSLVDTGVFATQLATETGIDLQAQQQDTRVYVLESDITQTQKSVRTQVRESRF